MRPAASDAARGALPAGWLALAVALWSLETFGLSYLVQRVPIGDVVGPARMLRDVQHWLFRFLIAYGFCVALLRLATPGRNPAATRAEVGASPDPARRTRQALWGLVHLATLPPLAILSARLFAPPADGWALRALGWHALEALAIVSLAAAAAPLAIWRRWAASVRGTAALAAVPALVAVLAIDASQRLWRSTARLTFELVRAVLGPFEPGLWSDPQTLTLGTRTFAVQIADVCSGLEGIGLVIAFCGAWLWLNRRTYRFPRALLVLPIAAALVFAFNVVRLAAMVSLGSAGHPDVAVVGFHSQAGWIAFNAVTLGVIYAAHRSRWLSVAGPGAAVAASMSDGAEVTAYLMPFLAVLAAGMVARALSSGFEYAYGLRVVAAGIALLALRDGYSQVRIAVTARAVFTGVLVFIVWVIYARATTTAEGPPAAWSALPPFARLAWVCTRLAGAVVIAPLTEELAFRGYLMRRLVRAQFSSQRYAGVPAHALVVSAALFALLHGTFAAPAFLAGLGYAWVARRADGVGEAVVAHATTNLLVSAAVLGANQWQLW